MLRAFVVALLTPLPVLEARQAHTHTPAAASAVNPNAVAEQRLREAQDAAQAGDWEGCARGYIEAYLRSDRSWPLQYNCLSGFASVLREGHVAFTEYNSLILHQLAEDKSAPTIHRIQVRYRTSQRSAPRRLNPPDVCLTGALFARLLGARCRR